MYIGCYMLLGVVPVYATFWPMLWDVITTQSLQVSFSGMTHRSSAVHNGVAFTTILSIWFIGYAAIGRWLTDRTRTAAYIVYVISTLALLLLLIILFFRAYGFVLLYITSMGYTPKRALGVVWGIVVFVGIVAFVGWALYPPRPKERSP